MLTHNALLQYHNGED